MTSVKQRYSKSSGYVLVLFALVLGVLVSIAGVAVDIGNLYIIRNRLERAAKAGALAGVGYRSLRGWDYFSTYAAGVPTPQPTPVAELFGVMSGVVKENMQAAFSAPPTGASANEFAINTPTLTTDNLTVTNANFYDPQTDTFSINATYKAPTFIIGRLGAALGAAPCPLSNGKYRCPITVTEKAQLERAVVALLLDTSGSMNCPANNAPGCACRSNTIGNGCATTGRVIDALVAALDGFRRFFNPKRDYITVIPFNLAAFNAFPIVTNIDPITNKGPPVRFGDTQARYTDFINKTSLAGLTPKSNTNICDAFIEAIAELKRITNLADFHPFVIAFTDGAPNAFRGEFKDGAGVGDLTRANNPASTDLKNDWYQYGVEWSTAATPPITSRAPGPLVNRAPTTTGTPTPLFNHLIGVPIAGTPAIWPTGSKVCGEAYPLESDHPAVLNSNVTPPAPSIRGCLSNLNFNIPGTGSTAGVKDVPIDLNGSAATKFNYAKLPYYCAIEAADYIRSNLAAPATVYTIGVGNPGSANCQDPFENVDNPLIRKDNFLARVALDPETLTESAGNFTVTTNSKFDFRTIRTNSTCNPSTAPAQGVGYNSINATKKTTPDVQGEYFATQDANELRTLFSIIAKQILLRLGT
jgi:Putative Flp pilus-assembly TadE/G-like